MVRVIAMVIAILLVTVLHARLRALMPKESLDDKLFITFSDRAGCFRVLYCSANNGSGSCGSCFQFCLITSSCRSLQRTQAGRYLLDPVNAHTCSAAVPNSMDERFGGRAHAIRPLESR